MILTKIEFKYFSSQNEEALQKYIKLIDSHP